MFSQGFIVGAAAGVTVAFLVLIVAFALIAWRVARDKKGAKPAKNMLEFYWAESLRIQQKNQKIMQAGLAWQMQNAGTFKAFEKRFAEWMHPKLGQDGTKEEHF